MADQLRADCWGAGLTGAQALPGAKLETPNLEALARRGTVFTRAYCPAAICGPSRMAFYTGQFASTHGSTVNTAPLQVGTRTLGDRLRDRGLRVGLAGKTHMRADAVGMARLGLSDISDQGVLAAECGFEPFARDDGLHPLKKAADKGYNAYLRGLGYAADNPWHDFANSALGPDGDILSGWYLRNADKAARIPAEHSETAWTTDRAIDFITDAGDTPWCLHVSYIKPHWPYIAPEPYCGSVGPDAVWAAAPVPENPHPVHRAFMDHGECVGFRESGARERVIPTYLALIREVDTHVGRLMAFLKDRNLDGETLVVFTSDHGDYLGDHGLGEKQLFHDPSARIPMIISHPDLHSDAPIDRPVNGVDLLPTFLEALGADPDEPLDLDGRSLMPLLRGEDPSPGRFEETVCELDYATRTARRALGIDPARARGWMVRTGRWKYIHWLDLPPQLYDLEDDPAEGTDRAADPTCAATLRDMKDRLTDHLLRRLTRCSFTRSEVESETDDYYFGGRIKMGVW